MTSESAGTDAAGAGEEPGILQRFETDNPFLRRLFASERFGVAPSGTGGLLGKLETVAPEEKVLSAMRVRHGISESGVLMVTTHWLRYVKQGRLFTAIASDEFWSLDGAFELEASMGGRPVFRTPDGNQFQVMPAIPIVSRREAKALLGIYKLAVLAVGHYESELQDAVLEARAPKSGGPAGELRELAALHESGALSEVEFEAAKARVLQSD